jgi:hypothetical protein
MAGAAGRGHDARAVTTAHQAEGDGGEVAAFIQANIANMATLDAGPAAVPEWGDEPCRLWPLESFVLAVSPFTSPR